MSSEYDLTEEEIRKNQYFDDFWDKQNCSSHALFCDSLENNADNATIDALKLINNEDIFVIEEKARDLITKANEIFKAARNSKDMLNESLELYLQALQFNLTDKSIVCQINTNIALVYMKLGKYDLARSYAKKALQYDSNKIKAVYICVKSSLVLLLYKQAINDAIGFLQHDEIKQLVDTAESKLKEQQDRKLNKTTTALSTEEAIIKIFKSLNIEYSFRNEYSYNIKPATIINNELFISVLLLFDDYGYADAIDSLPLTTQVQEIIDTSAHILQNVYNKTDVHTNKLLAKIQPNEKSKVISLNHDLTLAQLLTKLTHINKFLTVHITQSE